MLTPLAEHNRAISKRALNEEEKNEEKEKEKEKP